MLEIEFTEAGARFSARSDQIGLRRTRRNHILVPKVLRRGIWLTLEYGGTEGYHEDIGPFDDFLELTEGHEVILTPRHLQMFAFAVENGWPSSNLLLATAFEAGVTAIAAGENDEGLYLDVTFHGTRTHRHWVTEKNWPVFRSLLPK